jgi:hypothetical protein
LDEWDAKTLRLDFIWDSARNAPMQIVPCGGFIGDP